MSGHVPVLLAPALERLAVRPDGLYVDATFGRGGHSEAILARLGPDGRLIALDRDPDAVACARERFGEDARFRIVKEAFGMLGKVAEEQGVSGEVDGLLFDLGVSSPQLDDPARGFSFQHEGPLDMRMDPTTGESAARWLARADEDEIARSLKVFGEERFARRIARAIVAARKEAPIETTGRLSEVVGAAVPSRERNKHPATRTFQAIRITVNRELEQLEEALEASLQVLAPGGRLCVISFHSLEDRMVKRFMRDHAREDPALAGLPAVPPEARPKLKLVGKQVRAEEAESRGNVRSRSAVLRAAERLP